MKAMARAMVVVLASTLITLVPQASSSAACAEEMSLENYRIKIHSDRAVYHHGDVAKLPATVVRKETKEPIDDAYIGVGVSRGDHYLYDVGRTDSHGKAKMRIKIRNHMIPGYVTLQAYAYKRHADVAGCFAVSEYGYREIARAFRIKD